MIERLADIVTTQEEIIRLQSKAINNLFALLHQHMSAAELVRLPILADINRAAELRREMGGTDGRKICDNGRPQ